MDDTPDFADLCLDVPVMVAHPDPDVEAIAQIIAALRSLPTREARSLVLRYIVARFAIPWQDLI